MDRNGKAIELNAIRALNMFAFVICCFQSSVGSWIIQIQIRRIGYRYYVYDKKAQDKQKKI
jgi:hypothetical protein